MLFYKQRLVRILVPYYIMLGAIIIVNLLQGENTSVKGLLSSIMCLQWYGNTVPNCGHLWYISCILFCYLITPVLRWICEQNKNMSLIKKYILLALAILMLQATYSLGGMNQVTTSILPYILGYFISTNKTVLNMRGGVMLAILAANVGLYCLLYASEALGIFAVPDIFLNYYKSIVSGAITMFFMQYSFRNMHVRRLLDLSDKYSYGIYLTHHIFILGSLSLMSFTPYLSLNIAMILFVTVITGVALIWASDKMVALFKKRG